MKGGGKWGLGTPLSTPSSMFENGFTLPGSDVQILSLFRPMEFSIKLYMYNNVRMSKRSR